MRRNLLILGSALLVTAAAQAHTHLESSIPADKSKVAAPSAIELHFSEAARVTSLSLQKNTDAARKIELPPAKAAKDVSVPVGGLTAGDYKVSWRAASADGHVASGSFGFTVDSAARKSAAPDDTHQR